jgi:DNA primase
MKSVGLLEEIKSHADIVEFISDYVALKKSGQNYKGLCPFHSEKTPSFMVSRSKQIFHCFGCGAGGDVVTFLMKHDNLTFGEALSSLAKKFGIKITESAFDRKFSERRQHILQANEEAMKFYTRTLRDSNTAMEYLKQRGISEDSIAAFCIGYAPDQRNILHSQLKKLGTPDSVMIDAGLVIADGKGHRDWFRRRIIFPIVTIRNDVIAFGGRVMDDAMPKYLNTPETEIFKKSETLFAINLAKDEIRKKGYAIIVEGYLDAVMCHQHGFRNAVAPLGTALTARHIQKLKSRTSRVVLIFDGDDAGIAAARRSLSLCCEHDISARILPLPRGEDPDSFLRKAGSHSFQKSLSSSQSMIEFLLSGARGENIDLAREALAMIASMKDMLLADELVRELSDRSKIHETALRSELEKMRLKGHVPSRVRQQLPAPQFNREELILLSTLLSFPEKSDLVLSQLAFEDIRDETIRSLMKKISKLGGQANITALLKDADEGERTLITGLSVNPGFDPEHVDTNIADCLSKLRQKKTDRERQIAEDSGDIVRLDSLLKDKRKHIKQDHA